MYSDPDRIGQGASPPKKELAYNQHVVVMQKTQHFFIGDLNTYHLNTNRKHLNTKVFEVQNSKVSVFKWSVYVFCPMY